MACNSAYCRWRCQDPAHCDNIWRTPEIEKELVRPAKRDTTAIQASLGLLPRPQRVTSSTGVTTKNTVHW